MAVKLSTKKLKIIEYEAHRLLSGFLFSIWGTFDTQTCPKWRVWRKGESRALALGSGAWELSYGEGSESWEVGLLLSPWRQTCHPPRVLPGGWEDLT